jgi:hypothetical protein
VCSVITVGLWLTNPKLFIYLCIPMYCFSCYRFLLVDFGLAQCVTTDFPLTHTLSEPTLRVQKRKREEVNINIGVQFNTFPPVSEIDHLLGLCPDYHTQSRSDNRLCGLVVRVLGYRSGGPGSIPGTTIKKSSGSGTGSTQSREYN